MILNTVSVIETAEDIEATTLRFQFDPEDLSKNTGDEALYFQCFYVYKTTEEWILLGEDPVLRVEEKEAKQAIAGWVPKDRVTLWNTRVAVEPNWEPEAKRERCWCTKAKFVTDEYEALKYHHNRSIDSSMIIWDQDNCNATGRFPPEQMRFPVLETNSIVDENIFKTCVTSQTVTLARQGEIISRSCMEAYSSYYIVGQQYPLFKKVVLFSYIEL